MTNPEATLPGGWMRTLGAGALLFAFPALAHNLTNSNAEFLASIDGPAIALFIYLGAKHMVTGIDHVLYLLAVVFFIYQPRQIVRLVTLFALGHSVTLIVGVWFSLRVNPGLIDALIGLSVAYKAFENLGGFARVQRYLPPIGVAVFGFGLIHGLGLATKLQSVYSGNAGLFSNLIAFNVGVELGQLLALALLLSGLVVWRARSSFSAFAGACNFALLVCGFSFAGFHWLGLSLMGNNVL